MTYEAEMDLTQANSAGGFGGESETVNAADLYTPEANGAGGQPDANGQADAPAQEQAAERRYTSGEMSETVRKRLEKEHRKAAWVLGNELLQERMRADNIDETEALKRIRDERIKAKAAAFKENPEQAFEELLRQTDRSRVPEEETQTSEARAGQIYNELTEEIRSGKVPQNFDITTYLSDPVRAREFLGWRDALGIEQACAIAMRMTAPAPTKTEQNRMLPKPIGTNNSYNPKPVDFSAMSSEQFREYSNKIKQAARSGKRVQF